ncbi:MAG TPA: endolytic transglycosylase MltG, partial [Geminicoccaceae bacterium]
MRRLLLRSFLILLLLAVAAAGGGWLYLERWLDRPGPLAERAVVQFPPGAGVAGIAGRLAAAGAVDHPLLFRLGARLDGRDRGLKAGEYALDPGLSPRAILDLLGRGEVLLHRVAVPEGLTVREVLELLAGVEVLSGEPPAEPPPEGTLLPETYLVPRGEPLAAVVARMREGMRRALAELWPARAAGLPL